MKRICVVLLVCTLLFSVAAIGMDTNDYLDIIEPKSRENAGADWYQATHSAQWNAREIHTSVVFNDKMWVMGGYDGDRRNDVWSSSDGVTWTEATSAVPWGARERHSSVVYDNKIWIMGGHDINNAPINDVWYTSDGETWTEATEAADWVARRGQTSVVFDDKMWVIGGFKGDTGQSFNDVWYSTDGADWTLATADAGWCERYGHTSVVFDDNIWVIGGLYTYSTTYLNDVWFSSDGITWTEATADADWDERRFHTSVVFDNKMWVIGGHDDPSGAPGQKNDVWSSPDGVSWTLVTASAQWIARSRHTSVIFDNKVWVIGGRIGDTHSQMKDVWYSDISQIPQPSMYITKWAPTTATPGEIITYWINYTNVGLDTAYDVMIVETYPPNVTFVSSIPVPDAGDNIWYIGNLAVGASGSIQINVLIGNDPPSSILNTVEFYYNNSIGEQMPPEIATAITQIQTSFGPVHNIDTDEYFDTIQEAIGDLDTLHGHTIEVAAGSYYENVIVNKMLTLVGEDRSTTIVDGGGDGDVVTITNDGVILTGFTVRNSGPRPQKGISLDYVEDCSITNNIITNNYFGIHTWFSHNSEISGCIGTDNSQTIYLGESSGINITECDLSLGSGYGVVFGGSFSNIISKCEIYENSFCGVYAFNSRSIENSIISSNIHDNKYGININTNSYSHFTIKNCNISRNYLYGIYLEISSSTNVYHNNILDNLNQAFDESTNTWDDSYPSGGNYWSDYSGIDQYSGPNQDIPGSDGIGDTPYIIDADTKDNYPLMNPWTPQSKTATATGPQGAGHDPIITITYDWTGTPTAVDLYYSTDDGDSWNYLGTDTSVDGSYDWGPESNPAPKPSKYYWIANSQNGADDVGIPANGTLPEAGPFNWKTYDLTINDMQPLSNPPSRWEFVSIPLNVNGDLLTVFDDTNWGDGGTTWDYIQWYDANAIADPWKSYSIHRPPELNDMVNVNNTMGFWIYLTSNDGDGVLTVGEGIEAVTTNINLYAGWNLVGYPTLNPEKASNALWGTGADSVMVCDTSEPYRIKEVGPTYLMKPGEGYWVHVPADIVWVVDW